MTAVVDSSVVLAWLLDEPGSDVAEQHLMEGVISAVNWSEVIQKARHHGTDAVVTATLLSSFGLTVADAAREDAEVAAGMWRSGTGLSLADRFCLATALRLELTAVTADRRWSSVEAGPTVTQIR
ncbi:MAG: type II toxin-antitoxin system VapC family toxin [Candidatus Limnocylindria bacterium]